MSEFLSVELPGRVALVHEWFTPRSVGGSEQVVMAIDQYLRSKSCRVDFASLVDGESIRKNSWLHGRSIQTSFIQGLPWGTEYVQQYLPLLPFAIEQIDLSEFPLVISSNHLVAKGVLLSPEQFHLSYVHTPVRYAWDQMNTYLNSSSLKKLGLEPFIRWQLHSLRQWDQLTAKRVDCLVANSRFTAQRISKYWGRQSAVVHPPVSVERFKCNKDRDEYYVCLCRLVPNKRVDLVVHAFNNLKLPLLVIGEGSQKKFLKKIAGPTVKILGYQEKRKVEDLLERCRAYVYAGVEDFGIAPVEAMAAGAPVIALAKGGLLDTVCCASTDISSATGVLFSDQKVQSLVQAIEWFEEKQLWKKLDPVYLNSWALRFSHKAFKQRFEKVLTKAWSLHEESRLLAKSNPASFINSALSDKKEP